VVPQDETITGISAQFQTGTAVILSIPVTLTAQIYESLAGGPYVAVPGATVSLTPLSGTVPVDTTVSGSVAGLSIPVPAGATAVILISANSTGVITTLSGSATVGVSYSG
jgi:hypothetical protein